ncbi:MAG: glucoamylase family protein [Bacteroidia bacterium]
MKNFRLPVFLVSLLIFVWSCKKDPVVPPADKLQLSSLKVGTKDISFTNTVNDVPLDQPVVARFAVALDVSSVTGNVLLYKNDSELIPLTYNFLDNNKTISAKPAADLLPNTPYKIVLTDQIKGENGETFDGLTGNFNTLTLPLILRSASVDGQSLQQSGRITGVEFIYNIEVVFSEPVDLTAFREKLRVTEKGVLKDFSLTYMPDSNNAFILTPASPVASFSVNELKINPGLLSLSGSSFTTGLTKKFYAKADTTPKFPVITDEALLTLVQEQTFKYFWDFAHPVSGLSRERNTSGDIVTSGGSGFGLMSILVGIERGFITRQEGVDRLEKIVNFLATADRFHGAWSHWLNGNTGKVVPFSPDDNGGDLVETSYMAMGLLTVRQYLNDQNLQENDLISKINLLWESIEWDWYTQGGQNVLYWHWSPNFGWVKNHKITGYNEALITYVMAAASPTHSISPAVYQNGWAQNGAMANGNTYYSNYLLPLGPDYGGPLFFEQYTFLGINPTNLTDAYANYWQQVVNHTLINREYCIRNPQKFVGYSDQCWGLTASDNHQGYSAHSPTNDLGVITPTAAISSIPFTPTESMDAIRYFYYVLGDKLWGQYGFYDAFNLTESWTATSYLAIDQGPEIVMIENYRSGLLWNLFMSCPETQSGLTKLGFTY